MSNKLTYDFLRSFFNLFSARIEGVNVVDNKVYGCLKWEDDDEIQEFVFENNLEDTDIFKLKILCDFIFNNGLNAGDKITITENELIQKLNKVEWNEFDSIYVINKLCDLEIKMIDDDEETDSFFLHF